MCLIILASIFRKGLTGFFSAFAAFPDTANQSTGTQVHSFRIRSEIVERLNKMGEDDAILHSADGFLYGYSAFIQQRDKSSKRGYSQVRYLNMDYVHKLSICFIVSDPWSSSPSIHFRPSSLLQ
jgi:hypothetical protein